MFKKEIGFSRMIWLKPTIFYQLLPLAKAGGNLAEVCSGLRGRGLGAEDGVFGLDAVGDGHDLRLLDLPVALVEHRPVRDERALHDAVVVVRALELDGRRARSRRLVVFEPEDAARLR